MKKFILFISALLITVSAQAHQPYKLSEKEWAIVNAILLDDISSYYNGDDSIIGELSNSRPLAAALRIYQEIEIADGVGGDISKNAGIIVVFSIVAGQSNKVPSCGINDKKCVEEIRLFMRDATKPDFKPTIQMLEVSGWNVAK